MRRLSKNKNLNDVLTLQQLLLWEATNGMLGQKPTQVSEIPYIERMKLLTAMQNSVLIANKVDPKKQTSGLSELRDMMIDKDEESLGDLGGEIGDGSTENKHGRIKPATANGTTAYFEAASADDTDGETGPIIQ